MDGGGEKEGCVTGRRERKRRRKGRRVEGKLCRGNEGGERKKCNSVKK